MAGKTTYKFRLDSILRRDDLRELSPDKKRNLKQDVGEMIVDLILEKASSIESPVQGGKWKKELSPEYKKIKQKMAPGVPNLELTGKMLDALKFKPYRDGVEVGLFKDAGETNLLKSQNHNKWNKKAHKSKTPERQFIPRKGQKFKKEILNELKTLAKEVVDDQD
jgi:hypothetical protein